MRVTLATEAAPEEVLAIALVILGVWALRPDAAAFCVGIALLLGSPGFSGIFGYPRRERGNHESVSGGPPRRRN